MQQHIKVLVHLLAIKNDNALVKHYVASNEAENHAQLVYLFQQGDNDLTQFHYYQQLAAKLIESKSLPIGLIAEIVTSDTLSFFTSALQSQENFKKTDYLERNVLHYLFAGNSVSTANPPFNYLRSMMLFESNGALRGALCQRDKTHLTAIEVYLHFNQNLTALPAHELTALMALIEIESKQQAVSDSNYIPIIAAVARLCKKQEKEINSESQRLILIAIYFNKKIEDVVEKIHSV